MTVNEHKAGTTASLNEKLKQEKADNLLEHPDYIELQKKLTESEEKASQNWDRCLRIQAETENALRRAERDVANAHKYALEKFLNELLPIIDSLERAIAVPEDQASHAIEGVNLTLRMLYSALEKFGIQQVDPLSHPFNPELHQAVSTQDTSDVKPGTILSVLQKGYLLNNRLVRPALVVVAKGS